MLIYLQIFDLILKLQAYMIEKIRDLVGIYYELQSKGIALLRHLSNGHAFLDLNLDKV